MEEEDCKKIIKQAWQVKGTSDGTWQGVQKKLQDSKNGLLQWRKVNVRPNEVVIRKKKEQLTALQEDKVAAEGGLQKKLKEELANLMDKEDLFWRQRARENWLKWGDRNSRFYNACANQKRKAKIIQKISDEHGSQWENLEDILEMHLSTIISSCLWLVLRMI